MNATLDYTSAVSSAASNIGSQIQTLLPYGLEIGAALVAVFTGWKVIKRFIK